MWETVVEFFNYIFDVPFVMQLVCFAVSTVLLVGTDYKKGWKLIPFFVDTVVLSVFFLFVNLLYTVLSRLMHISIISAFSYFTGIAVYAAVRSRHSVENRFAMSSVVFALTTLISALGTILGNAISANTTKPFDVIFVTKIISYVAVVAFSILLYKYPLFKYKTNYLHAILNVACNLLSAGLFIAFEYMRQSGREFMEASDVVSVFVSLVAISLFCINIVTYFMTYFLCKERQAVIEYRLEKQKGQQLKELLQLSEHKLAELKEVRHDVKNQYAYMQVMLENEKYDELKKYFAELIGTFSKPLYECVASGNEVVDSILNLELSKAGECGVQMNVRVTVPSELPFSKSGLLGIFTNVIDNAIEACSREKIADSCVDVTLSIQGDYLLFCVVNPTNRTDGEISAEEPSVKSHAELHGYGMKIVKKLVKKYNGFYRNYVRDGKFFAECLLDLRYKDKK